MSPNLPFSEEVRNATVADREALAKVFALSLRERTFVGYLCSPARDPLAALESYFKICYDTSQRCTIYGNGKGGALWEEPNPPKHLLLTLKLFAVMASFAPWQIPLCLRATFAKNDARPKEPHFYLNVLGVHPDHQGEGIGAKLLRHTLVEVDEKKMGAYLETGNPDNIPFYEKFGFRHRATATVPGAKMPFHTMWRDPA